MRSYFFRNIINQIVKKKLESFIIGVIVFFMTFSLSLLYFFGYNDSIESNIGNNLDLSYEINQNHIFAKYNKEINDWYTYFSNTVNWIGKVGENEVLDYYNYNITMTLFGNLKETDKNDIEISNTFYGISDKDFLLENQLELKEGRFFTQEELDNSNNVIVVSDQLKVYVNGESRNVHIGDKFDLSVNFDMFNLNETRTVEVIGIYKDERISEYFTLNDTFPNSHGTLISNKIMFDYVMNYTEEYNLENVTINHILFKIGNYEDYLKYKTTLIKEISDFNDEMKDLGEPTSKITVHETNETGILESVSQIKGIYNIVFISVFSIIALVLIISFYYILKKKTGEISIYYSLGESRTKIVVKYMIMYSILSIAAIILGLIAGYFFSKMLTESMLNESIQLKAELSRFKTGVKLEEMINYTPEYVYTISSSIKVAIEVFGIVCASVLGTMITILNSKIFTRNGGWNA